LLENSFSFSGCSFIQVIALTGAAAGGNSGQKSPATEFCRGDHSQDRHSQVLPAAAKPTDRPGAGRDGMEHTVAHLYGTHSCGQQELL